MATASAPVRPSSRPMADTGLREGYAALPTRDEAKPSTRTTEFYIYLVAVAAVLLASYLVGLGSVAGLDPFPASQAWLYVSLLTIGYLVSRGLAKAGSSWRRTDDSAPRIQMGSQPGAR